MDAREIAKLAVNALEDKKAQDIKVIDISEISTIADYFIIASGNNRSQIQAMCDHVEEELGRNCYELRLCLCCASCNGRKASSNAQSHSGG